MAKNITLKNLILVSLNTPNIVKELEKNINKLVKENSINTKELEVVSLGQSGGRILLGDYKTIDSAILDVVDRMIDETFLSNNEDIEEFKEEKSR